jgi:RTC4-like domain
MWDLFPDLSADLYNDRHLHPESFVSRVLVPEAARLLIKEDLNLSDEEALDVLQRSRAFGIALHPDVDSECD